jgi:putative addiction module component (TIGR02574 family)
MVLGVNDALGRTAHVVTSTESGAPNQTNRDTLKAADEGMTNNPALPPPGFDDLPVEDQIDYVQSLWDRIAAKPDQVPVPEWHKQVLSERLAAQEVHPEAARPWEEVRDEIRSKLVHKSER